MPDHISESTVSASTPSDRVYLVEDRRWALAATSVAVATIVTLTLLLLNPWAGRAHDDGYVVAVSTSDGKVLWSTHLPRLVGFLSGMRVDERYDVTGMRVDERDVIVTAMFSGQGCYLDQRIVRLDKATGRVVDPDVKARPVGNPVIGSTSIQVGDAEGSYTAKRRNDELWLEASRAGSEEPLWQTRLPDPDNDAFKQPSRTQPASTTALAFASDGVVYLAYGISAVDCSD